MSGRIVRFVVRLRGARGQRNRLIGQLKRGASHTSRERRSAERAHCLVIVTVWEGVLLFSHPAWTIFVVRGPAKCDCSHGSMVAVAGGLYGQCFPLEAV